jgi:hypothetical protein
MKKDIPFLPVKGVAITIARESNESGNHWNVYIINENEFPIENITIRSKGYGEKEGKHQSTSTLRHHIQHLGKQSHALIEPIDPEVFHLYNEYWISYFVKGQVFDKKYIFVPESIIEDNLILIPQLQLQGILHN